MNIKIIIFFSSFLFFINIVFATGGLSYTKDQEKLVPLEKETLMNWINENCYENHKTWQELIADGRIKCKRADKPESFSSLSFVKHFTSFSSADFRINSTESYIIYFIQLICLLVIIYFLRNNIAKNRIFGIFVSAFIIITAYEVYEGMKYYNGKYVPYPIKTIYDAVEENNLGMVKHFVEDENVNPNDFRKSLIHLLPSYHKGKKIKKQYVSALDIAAYRKHNDIASYLAEFTPELNSKYSQGRTVLNSAAATGNFELVKKVLDRDGIGYVGRDIPNLTPLHYAVCANNIQVVTLLADSGAKLDEEMEFRTPLDTAIWCGNMESVKFLLPRIKNPRNNPIETALAAGDIKLYNYFISLGYSTERWLEIAAKFGNYNMLEYLESVGEFRSLNDKQIERAISEVERLNELYGALYLFKIEKDIALNITNNDKSNLLITAVKLQKIDLVERLLSKGFNLKDKDVFGYNVLDYAVSTKNNAIINLLKSKM
jgi:ankyrin repeat protein